MAAPSERAGRRRVRPVYNEPVDIVEPTVAAAARLRGARVRVWLLDDGNRRRHARRSPPATGVGLHPPRASTPAPRRATSTTRCARTDAPFVAVLDCDHVPDAALPGGDARPHGDDPRRLRADAAVLRERRRERLAAAAWSQQALFFGAIARGKDGHDAMFCCGTNVLFRRAALESVGGFPTNSLTEDFELSSGCTSAGWESAYVPEVLARGLGPEDMASYVCQQHRWARGCLSARSARRCARGCRCKLKAQYLLSARTSSPAGRCSIYMSFPVIRILTGGQPIARHHRRPSSSCTSRPTSRWRSPRRRSPARARTPSRLRAGGGQLLDPLPRHGLHGAAQEGSFVVTPKKGAAARQPSAVMPALVVVGHPGRR